jgi:hypothetical protein
VSMHSTAITMFSRYDAMVVGNSGVAPMAVDTDPAVRARYAGGHPPGVQIAPTVVSIRSESSWRFSAWACVPGDGVGWPPSRRSHARSRRR